MPNNLEGPQPPLGELIPGYVSDLLFRGLSPALKKKKMVYEYASLPL